MSVALLMAFGKYENSSTIAGGHVWVADGVWEIGMIVHFYAYLAPVIGNDDQELVCVTDDTLKKYIHFNWGWGGDCNGYFLVDIFNANNAYQYDNSSMTNTCDDISWNESFEYLLYEP